jgi:hypothetical protein
MLTTVTFSLFQVEVEQRTWCHSEELRSRMTIIHTLEGSLSALGTQHATELQRNTQQVHTISYTSGIQNERKHTVYETASLGFGYSDCGF